MESLWVVPINPQECLGTWTSVATLIGSERQLVLKNKPQVKHQCNTVWNKEMIDLPNSINQSVSVCYWSQLHHCPLLIIIIIIRTREEHETEVMMKRLLRACSRVFQTSSERLLSADWRKLLLMLLSVTTETSSGGTCSIQVNSICWVLITSEAMFKIHLIKREDMIWTIFSFQLMSCRSVTSCDVSGSCVKLQNKESNVYSVSLFWRITVSVKNVKYYTLLITLFNNSLCKVISYSLHNFCVTP